LRVNGLIQTLLVTTTAACLMGLVASPEPIQNSLDASYVPDEHVLVVDSPDTEDDEEPLKYKFDDHGTNKPLQDPKSKLYLSDPENVKTEVKYDPATGNYLITDKIGDMNYRPPTYMTPREFQQYMFKRDMRDYWRSRVAADELNQQPRKGLIPPLKVNSELFDRIFGGSTVDIKPTGLAELIFGATYNKNLNPAIPQRQQRMTNFDFNMRLQLNLIGKIGDKLKISTNYNTEASFDWENQIKVDYTGYEDDIIKKIEAGNVTLPLNSSLISGSQTLFGFKTELQFGKLRATVVLSQQKGKKTEITVQGGAQTQQFALSADAYEQNRHFFLGHYFRDHYDGWMRTLPVINTPVVITKIEVYVVGINGSAEQTRQIAAFQDLGEDGRHFSAQSGGVTNSLYRIADNDATDSIPYNNANSLYAILTNSVNGMIRDRTIDNVSSILSTSTTASNSNYASGAYMDASRDYNIIRNARKLNAAEYYFNPRTGYISLNQQLNNEQALAVSYQYTYKGKTYQVGEFTENVPDNSKLLVCKLLKSNVVNVRQPVWQLMMKNVYSIGAYNLNPQDFRLDVVYNNIESGIDMPYLPVGRTGGPINGVQLIRVLGCDRLSVNGDPYPDGVFDLVANQTFLQTNGRIYLPMAEPFGRGLASRFEDADFPTANNYIFTELYDSTRTAATFIQNKNRFKLKGTYRSSSGSEIALNAMNIPQGAVVVTANGVTLTENTDYQVDYSLGRVKIINEGIINSGATIKVTLESNSLFSVQQKNLMGTRLDYKVNRDLTIGGTFLRFSERPLTQKVSIGDEPVSNLILGTDVNHRAEVPFLTRVLDKLPLFSTKEMSSITTRAEIAKLFPGNAAAIRSNGGNSYIDDFEGSISLIDIKTASAWYLASIPQGQPRNFPEANESNSILTGINRARLSWYNVDFMFTRDQGNTTPRYYSSDKLFDNNMWRQVFETELFPGKMPPNGQQVVLPLLDLVYYPDQRGPYNYDVKGTKYSAGINNNGTLARPDKRWAGIMRRLETNDFQASNVEYIQFWLMDPYNEDYSPKTDPSFSRDSLPFGDMYINIGSISEDIVKDGRMVYENGLPGTSDNSKSLKIDSNNVANIPVLPPIINAFSQDNNDRSSQDVGYDGMSDAAERARFAGPLADMLNGPYTDLAKAKFQDDPSSDRYHFFRGDDYDDIKANTLRRYWYYNNAEGNSPTQQQYEAQNPNGGGYPTGATTLPNIEDINRDNTLSEAESYYQYHVRINPQDLSSTAVGSNFIVDAFDGSTTIGGVTKTVKWYQFKIPISQFEENVNNLEGLNSIRFMRVYLKNFDRPVVLRMARFELVRSDWRRYQYDLRQNGEYIAIDNNSTSFDVSAVSVQENANKVPINYVMPPGIEQQQNVQTTNLVLMNEQALQMRVCDLRDGDSRAAFKNTDLDTRMFKNIKMQVHAESSDGYTNDGDLQLFFRVGSDYNNNYYEYTVPLKLTPKGVYVKDNDNDRRTVWPAENEVNLKFDDVTLVKDLRNQAYGYYADLNLLSSAFTKAFDGYSITIVGNPNLGTIKSLMVGIRNPKDPQGISRCAEVWVNELRLTDFDNRGGWATTGQVQAKLADLGMVSLTGTYKSPFWGGVESKINDRSRETNRTWDMSSTINTGKFFPNKWKVNLPVYYNFGQTKNTPLFNPLDPDVYMKDFKANDKIDADKKEQILKMVEDYSERKGFNLSNVRIDGLKKPKAKPYPWDVSNFTFTYAYNELFKRNSTLEYRYDRTYRGNLQYQFAFKTPYSFKPFAKSKRLSKKAYALIKDFNLQLMPNSFGMSMDVDRTYSAMKNRDVTSIYSSYTEFPNPTLVNKNFTVKRNYNFRWDISKSIKYDYTAVNEGRILEAPGEMYKGKKGAREYVWNTFMNGRDTMINDGLQNLGKFGENTVFRQQMNLNVDVPIHKIPLFDFVKATYRFGGTYTWTRRPFAAADSIGNTIQNTGSHVVSGSMNLLTLYNKVPFLKKALTPKIGKDAAMKNPNAAKPPMKDGKREMAKDTVKKDSKLTEAMYAVARTLMMVKNVQFSYTESRGQLLPNFRPRSQYGGMDFRENKAPGFLFTTGLYDAGIREHSAENGWIAKVGSQTTSYTETFTRNYNYKATVEPHGSLKLELSGNYSKQTSRSEYILYDNINDQFNFHSSPSETGNFSMSTMKFFKGFSDGRNGTTSEMFNRFLAERKTVAIELGAKNPYSSPYSGLGEVDGYSSNQQDVLMRSFYRIYAGRDLKNYTTRNMLPTMPLPNWTLSWDGLGKLKLAKKYFKGITVKHGYRSTYQVNGYSNNVLFNADGVSQIERMPVSSDTSGSRNFVSYYLVNSITLSERYDPLLRFDFQFKQTGVTANVEMKRDRTTNLNLTGFQIIETKGQEFVVGLGYLVKSLKFKKIKIMGKALDAPLNVKVDFSYRKNITILRQISDGSSAPTSGANVITLRSSADYSLTQNITLRLYCDYIRTTPQTSASFPTANLSTGFSLRINIQ